MKLLGKQTNDFILSFTDKNRENDAYFLTEDEFLNIHAWLNKAPQYKDKPLYDIILKGKYKETVGRNDIRLKKISREAIEDKMWICNYGTRHYLHQQCDCQQRFKHPYFVFLDWCNKHYSINYSYDITTEMQIEFIKLNT